MSLTFRPLALPDAVAARALADAVLAGAPFAEGMLAALDEAVTSGSGEYHAVGAHDGSSLMGFVVFGEIAGALGAGRISLVVVDPAARRRGIATALIDAACDALRSRGARFVAMELAEEPRLDAGRALAQRAGFRREGGVSDYVRDGVGLALLRRDLGEG